MRKKVALFWHSLSYNYNDVIMKDCLCHEMKTKIKVKRDYHSAKIKELVSSNRVGSYLEK
ncbi:hypothetical protein MKZ26_18525 [Sporosarcina sp. FSL K6-6792]|uniref:hypothetical protein n=1 Tax=Sporosarcina sp. FSL K6-6792 TaxID=2921559 RepID=UPI0030F65F49